MIESATNFATSSNDHQRSILTALPVILDDQLGLSIIEALFSPKRNCSIEYVHRSPISIKTTAFINLHTPQEIRLPYPLPSRLSHTLRQLPLSGHMYLCTLAMFRQILRLLMHRHRFLQRRRQLCHLSLILCPRLLCHSTQIRPSRHVLW